MSKNQKITDLIISNKDIKKISVYLDDHFFLEIDQNLVNEFDLYVGKILDDSLVDFIKKRESLNMAKKDALRYLSYRARTEKEMIQKLQEKKYLFDIIDETIQWLKEKDFIDDHKFCLIWIQDRIKQKPIGKLRIRKELYNKGIDHELIEKVLNSFFKKDDDELDLAYQVIKIKKGALQSKNIEIDPQKIINLLKYRGFSNEVIHHIVSDWNPD